jgi:hypothetical protein
MDNDAIAAARSRLVECTRKLESSLASSGKSGGWTEADWAALAAMSQERLAAERSLARVSGQQYAVVIDLDIAWDIGAPMPFVAGNGHQAGVVFYLRTSDPDWDGTHTTVVDPADSALERLGVITFHHVHEIKFGGLNDEAIEGHPLAGKGLDTYAAHEVVDSQWIAEAERQNSVHPAHRGGWHARMKHYILCFHDETLECLAEGLQTQQLTCSYPDAIKTVTAALLRD